MKYPFLAFALVIAGYQMTFAQPAAGPTSLRASYKQYANRIELTWDAASQVQKYHVYRKLKGQKRFDLLGAVGQNRYIDRNQLYAGIDYIYVVHAVDAQGTESAPSQEATGALLTLADPRDTIKIGQMPLLPDSCLKITIMDAKYKNNNYILRYLLEPSCGYNEPIQMRLYHSADAQLDASDTLLKQESLTKPAKRGALIAKNDRSAPTKGFLLLEVTPTRSAVKVLAAPL
jgi:hypothetical protein